MLDFFNSPCPPMFFLFVCLLVCLVFFVEANKKKIKIYLPGDTKVEPNVRLLRDKPSVRYNTFGH